MAGRRVGITHFGRVALTSALSGLLLFGAGTAGAWTSKDGSFTAHGFLDYTHHAREGYGIVKSRSRA